MANYITPNLEAEIAPYGILSPSAVVTELPDGAWETKFEYTDFTCNTEVNLSGICIPGVNEEVVAIPESTNGATKTYFPFSIEASFRCSTMGMTPEEVEKIGRDNLDLATQKAIEVEFHDGVLAQEISEAGSTEYVNPYLTDGTAIDITPVPGTGVSADVGLALLEDAIGDSGSGLRGTIHAPRSVISIFGSKRMDKDDEFNGAMYTENGNYIVSGVGYSGTSPTGEVAAPGTAWAYATGKTYVFLGPANVIPNEGRRTISQAVDIQKNSIEYIASRAAAVITAGCFKHAVLIDLTK